jgi:hypothetical protein
MSRWTSWQRFVAVAGVALLVGVVGSRAPDVWADPMGYVFAPLAFLGTPTPEEGDTFLADHDSRGNQGTRRRIVRRSDLRS